MQDSKYVKEDNYINIQGWMVTELGLKGNELLIYACIYGFSQDGVNKFTGSLQYLAEWTNSTKQGVMKNLKSLVEKEYIQKEEKIINGVKFCTYYTTELYTLLNKVYRGIQQSLIPPIQQSLPNNIDIYNKANNIEHTKVVFSENENESEISKKSSRKGKDKQTKYLDKINQKLLEYNFSEKVQDLILTFFEDKAELKQYSGENQLNAQLSRLADVDECTQIKAINLAIERGWKNISAYLMMITNVAMMYLVIIFIQMVMQVIIYHILKK